MKRYYLVRVHVDGRWNIVGKFRAFSAAGALQQVARDLRHFGNVDAIEAEEA